MAKSCPNCGYENLDIAIKCASCGTEFTSYSNNSPLPFGGNPRFVDGITYLRYYTIIGFISLAAGIILNFVYSGRFSYSYLIGPLGAVVGGTPATSANVTKLFIYSEIAQTVSAILTLIGLYLLYRGFSTLRNIDMQFSIGRTGTILEFAGMALVLIFTLLLLSTLSPAGNNIATLLGFVLLVLLAAILLLVGAVLVTIGLFRVGTQFDNSMVQAGAILSLFLGIIGVILLYIGLNEILNRLRRRAASAKAEK